MLRGVNNAAFDTADDSGQIGRFRLERRVGAGGMGVVYRAHDTKLNRPVAIKLIAAHKVDDASVRARFQREATALAALKHPHIALVYELGEENNQPFMAFEWIEGETLQAVLARHGRLPLLRALHILEQLSSALAYAHQQAVVHRDLKPSNILIGAGDQATLVDFGLAALSGSPTVTETGALLGTPRYMAPEQALGRSPDARTDQYSLALIAYEMLAGRGPFEDVDSTAMLYHQVHTPPQPISEVAPGLPPGIEAALERALSKEPERRFASLIEFWQALLSAAAGVTTSSQPGAALAAAGATVISGKFASAAKPSRRGIWSGLALIGGLVLLGSLAALAWPRLFPSPTQTITPTSPAGLAQVSQVETAPAVVTEALTGSLAAATEWFTPTGEISPTEELSETFSAPEPPYEAIWNQPGGEGAQRRFAVTPLVRLEPEPYWAYWLDWEAGTGAAAGDHLLALGSGGDRVTVLYSPNGEIVWETELGAPLAAAPGLFRFDDWNSYAYFDVIDDGLYAFDLDEGRLAWRLPRASLTDQYTSTFTVADNWMIYLATASGRLFAVYADSGEIAWETAFDDSFWQPPAVGRGQVFLAGDAQVLRALDMEGNWAWEQQIWGALLTPPVVLEGVGMVVVGTDSGSLHGFSTVRGVEIWQTWLGGEAAVPIRGLSADYNWVYVTLQDGRVLALDGVSGEVQWEQNLYTEVWLAPVNDGQTVLVPTAGGELVYLSAYDGSELSDWRIGFETPILATPLVVGEWVFVRTADALLALAPWVE